MKNIHERAYYELEHNAAVTWQIITAVFYYVIGRLLTTFIAAYAYGETWSIRSGSLLGLPVVGFSASEATYSAINSLSSVLIAAYITYVTITSIRSFKKNRTIKLQRAKALAWTLVSISLGLQLITGFIVNVNEELELAPWAFIAIAVMSVATSIYAYSAVSKGQER